jgi:heme/copper-type cytochrome/quinol oxidase subunit 4
MEAAAPDTTSDRDPGTVALLWAVLAGAAVALALGVYGRSHNAAGQALFTLGFSGTINMKAWLATLALVLAVVQIILAMWMYGKLGHRSAPAWVGPIHRLTGTIALLVTLPVVYHCLWSLGFETDSGSTRRFVHSILGCVFYGAFTTKVLCVRSTKMPGWALPVVGGALFACLVGLWLTSALWFFDNVGFPSF